MHFNSGNQPPPKTPLTTVLEIRLKHREGWSQARLAREYKLSVNTVHKMVTLQSYNKVAIMGAAPAAAPSASTLEESAKRLLAFQALLTENAEPPAKAVEMALDKFMAEPSATVYRCESCDVAEGGEHLESCQDASGGTIFRA